VNAAVEDRIVVAADVDAVFDVITDFDAYPQWQAEIEEAEILETGPDGRGTRVRFLVDATVIKARLVLDYTYTDTSMEWVLVEGDGVRRNDGRYDLRDLGDGTTEVTYALEVEPAVPVPGLIRRKAAKRIIDGALAGMKRRVEQH
jgi:ribosome-associated toxin RatA of RatAB toxin-antitoxin module